MNNVATENVTMFLVEETGSCYGTFKGRLPAAKQRELFGAVLFGRKRLTINGETEEIRTHTSVCFGTDTETLIYKWSELN